MTERNGTNGRDVTTVNRDERYFGMEGDDEITLLDGATAEGGAGNDTLIVSPGVQPNHATVWYWYSQNNILVDLQEGFATEGPWRDKLVNVHNVHGFKFDGDKGFGSSTEDYFWIGPGWGVASGTILIDGRDGWDSVTIGTNLDQGRGKLILNVSADGRVIKAHHQYVPGLIFELRNVESVVEQWSDGNNNWWSNTFDPVSLINLSTAGGEILLRGSKGWQSGAMGTATTLTYSFLSAPVSGSEGGSGFAAFSAAQQSVVRDILYVLQQQTGLAFQEVQGDAGQLRFGINQQANTRGYSFLPDAQRSDPKSGDVWLDVETAQLLGRGQEGFYVLLHEIAHALGLQHPLPETDRSGATVLRKDFATLANTLMLDVAASEVTDAWPVWYGAMDLSALRQLYGARDFMPGNDVYRLGDAGVSTTVTLLDDGGVDTIDVSGSLISAQVDLRQGKSSSVGLGADGAALRGNVTIATGTRIENVVSSLHDDVLIGNELDNWFTFLGGNDLVEGGQGRDVLRLWTTAAQNEVDYDSSSRSWNLHSASGDGGGAQLEEVERVLFADQALALDVHDRGNGELAARVLGAVFGPQSLKNLQLTGMALQQADVLPSADALMQWALGARLGSTFTHTALVDLLYFNLVGFLPSPADQAHFVKLLDSKSVTPLQLSWMAADLDLNTVNIDLVGISESGLPYLPYGG